MRTDNLNSKQRFDELIAEYVNDALEGQDRHWVEQYLRENPDSRYELAWHHQLKSANDIEDLQIPRDVGLGRLLKLVDADALKQPGMSDGLFGRFLHWLRDMNARPMLAFASLMVLAQAIALGFLTKQIHERDDIISDYSKVRAIPGQAGTRSEAVTLNVTFKSTATEQEIRLLLVSVQATIADGPKQLGDYTLAIPVKRFDEAKTALEQSAIVESVSQQRLPAL